MTPGALLVEGVVLGLSAGFTPGPLTALLIAETLRHGLRGGLAVAVVPMVTDGPLIIASMLLAGAAGLIGPLLGLLSLAGGALLIRYGIDALRSLDAPEPGSADGGSSFRRGIMVNLANPHLYLFWITVGGPIMHRAAGEGATGPITFAAGFLAAIVAAKGGIALTVAHAHRFTGGQGYRWGLRLLGAGLIGYGALLLQDGWRLMTQ